MDQSEIKKVSKRNADTIVITALIVFDLLLTLSVIQWAMRVEPVTTNPGLLYQPLRLFINYQMLQFGLVIKSAILFIIAFAIAK